MKFPNMSRVGRKPIEVPKSVEVTVTGAHVEVKGPKGTLTLEVPPAVSVSVQETDGAKTLVVALQEEGANAIWGTMRALLSNLLTGVASGFSRSLEINGIGYRAALKGKALELEVGFSHPVTFPLPDGVSATVEKNIVTISGVDKQLVGETAAQLRRIRPPEPYKGTGIKYTDEVVRRKAGKTAKTA